MDRVDHESVIDHHIGGKSQTRGVDAVIAALAERQHGVGRGGSSSRSGSVEGDRRRIGRAGCICCTRGSTRWGIACCHHTADGWPPCSPAGPGAVLSHRSAAALWGLRASREPASRSRPHETSAPETASILIAPFSPTTNELSTTASPSPPPPARSWTSPPSSTAKPLDRALNEAEMLRLPARHPPRTLPAQTRHQANLRTLLYQPPSTPTRTELEDRFLTFVDDHGLPTPRDEHHHRGIRGRRRLARRRD